MNGNDWNKIVTPEAVLDTSAIMAFWLNEPGAERIYPCFRERRPVVMHQVNICECMFALPRKWPGRMSVATAAERVGRLSILRVAWLDDDFCRLAAMVRLSVPALSVGDAMAVASAAMLEIPVLTADFAFRKAVTFAEIQMIR